MKATKIHKETRKPGYELAWKSQASQYICIIMQTNVRDKKGDDLKSKVETQIRPISDYFINVTAIDHPSKIREQNKPNPCQNSH